MSRCSARAGGSAARPSAVARRRRRARGCAPRPRRPVARRRTRTTGRARRTARRAGASVLVAQLGAAQHLRHALAEGVAELGHHARERAVGAVAPVERDGIEDVAETRGWASIRTVSIDGSPASRSTSCFSAPPSKWSPSRTVTTFRRLYERGANVARAAGARRGRRGSTRRDSGRRAGAVSCARARACPRTAPTSPLDSERCGRTDARREPVLVEAVAVVRARVPGAVSPAGVRARAEPRASRACRADART